MRFSRWSRKGSNWMHTAKALRSDAELEQLYFDSTLVRVRQHAAGAQKAEGCQALGRSRGGLNTKIYAVVGAFRNPLC